jgi:phosphoenolpyruvate carboxylase
MKHFGKKPDYIRAFLACSDSSLESSHLAGIIGNKLGLARLNEFAEQENMPVFPIAGPGSLTFRGGLTPKTVDRFLKELPGVRTTTVQSSFRYDNETTDVIAAIKRLEHELPLTKPQIVSQTDQEKLVSVARAAATVYQGRLSELLPDMQAIFKAMPKRRDRRQHTGLLAYNRTVGTTKMPRAITFSGGFYSIGVPPEFIGLGQTLQSLDEQQLVTLFEYYPSMRADMHQAGRFLNRDNLKELGKTNKGWHSVEKDVVLAEKILGLTFGPESKSDREHANLSASVIRHRSDGPIVTALINQSAEIRKSIG